MSYPVNRQALAQGHIEEGLRHLQEKALPSAVVSFETAAALAPNSAETFYQLSRAHVLMRHMDAAERAARAALDAQPGHPGAAHVLGAILAEAERLPEALVWLRVANAGAPHHAQILRDLAVVELFLGETDDAREHFMGALEKDVHSHEVLFNLVRITDMAVKSDRTELLMSALTALAAQSQTLSSPQRIQVFYALAKASEDRGDVDGSVEWLKKGSVEHRATLDYDGPAHIARLARTAEVFNKDLITGLAGRGLATDRPIFIVGMPRSGTTLVEQIISAHPQVYGAGENAALMTLVQGSTGPGGTAFPEWGAQVSDRDCASIGEAYLKALPTGPSGQPRTTDKRLENFEYLGLIHLCLPNAPIIHVKRDPRDVAFAAYALLFSEHQNWSYTFEELAAFWRAQERLMAHWKAVLPPGRILEVSYEALVRDFDGQARRMIAHCGLDWDEACRDFHKSKRPVRSASAVQVRQPIYDRSIGRSKRFEKHMRPLYEAMGLCKGRSGSRGKAQNHADEVG